MGADLNRADLKGVNLDHADLRDARLPQVDLATSRFEEANLNGADLEGANLFGTRLVNADFRNAKLANANFARANLNGANLANADLAGSNFVEADLSGADFNGATVDGATFDNAIVTRNTKGIEHLTMRQFEALRMSDPGVPKTGGAPEQPKTAVTPEVTADDVDPPNPDHAHALTVGYALSIVTPAHSALRNFATPNDISEQHRDLFDELRRTVAQLEQELADVQDENSLLSGENEELRKSINQALPLWERAWEEFVLKGAGAIGTTAGKAVVFSAGFIAGTLYMSFSSAAPGIDV